MSRPQVRVVSCGAIGALLAAHLAAVAEVSAFDIDAARVRGIQADCLGLPVAACRTVPCLPKGLEFAARLGQSNPTQTETTRS